MTYMGRNIDPLSPRADGIDIRDIAHALSLLCRANGHFPSFYSVAQHSIFCMKEAEARGYSSRVQLLCLLHDASEAYISDIIRPVKRVLPGYVEIEQKLHSAIFEKYLSPIPSEEELKQVSEIDDALLYHEFVCYMDTKLWEKEPPLFSKPAFVFEDFAKVENTFLAEFDRLKLLLSENGV
jgi:hypothetical protein